MTGDMVLLGKLGRTFRLEGGLRFHPLGRAEGQAVTRLDRVFVAGLGESAVRKVHHQGGRWIIYLKRVRRLEQAQQLVNTAVYATRDSLSATEEGVFFLDLLTRLPVFVDGVAYGRVVGVEPAGQQDLLILDSAGEERWVPLQAPYVRVTPERIEIDRPPPGLLEQE